MNMLTAKHVREAIEEAKNELLESCEYVGDMYQRQSDVLKAFGKMEQAIADELSAELETENEQLRMAKTLLSNSEQAKIEHIGNLESLVRDMWEGLDCFRCPMHGKDCFVKKVDEAGPCRMVERMNALGIEV